MLVGAAPRQALAERVSSACLPGAQRTEIDSAREAVADDDDHDDDLLDPDLPQPEALRFDEQRVAFAQLAVDAASAADVLSLHEQATLVRNEAELATPSTRDTAFGGQFVPHDHNRRSGFAEIRRTVMRFGESAQAWQLAADHQRALLHAARRLGLPANEIARIETGEADCAAQAQRQRIQRNVAQVIWLVKQLQSTHEPTVVRIALLHETFGTLMRDALQRCRSNDMAARPLRAEPLDTFDRELRHIDAVLQNMLVRVQDVSAQRREHTPLQTVPRIANEDHRPRWLPPHRPWDAERAAQLQTRLEPSLAGPQTLVSVERNWLAAIAATNASLIEVALRLRKALHGEEESVANEAAVAAQAAAAPQAPTDDHISALAEQLQQGLVLASNAEAAERAEAGDGAQASDAPGSALTAWHQAAQAYDECERALAQMSLAALPEAAGQPSVQALRQQAGQGLQGSIGSMLAALDRDFKVLLRQLHSASGRPAEAERLIEQCAQLQATLLESSLLQEHADGRFAPVRLAAPFAILQDAFAAQAVPARTVPETLERAEQLGHAARTAQKAARSAHRASAGSLRALAAECRELRRSMLSRALSMESDAMVEEFRQFGAEVSPVLMRAEEATIQVFDLLFDDPLPDGPEAAASSAAPIPGDDDEQLMEVGRRLADGAQERAERDLVFPPDTPVESKRDYETGKVVMHQLAASSRLAVEFLHLLEESSRELAQATPAQRPLLAVEFANRVSEAASACAEMHAALKARAGDDSLEEITVRDVMGRLRHSQRLAERMQHGLLALGKLFEARQAARALRDGISFADPAQEAARMDELRATFNQTIGIIEAAQKRLLGQIRSDPQAVEMREIDLRNIRSSFAQLRWRVTQERTIVQAKLMAESTRRNLAAIGDADLPPQRLSILKAVVANGAGLLTVANKELIERMRAINASRNEGSSVDAQTSDEERRKVQRLLSVMLPLARQFQDHDATLTALGERITAQVAPAARPLPSPPEQPSISQQQQRDSGSQSRPRRTRRR